ncbi:Head virion protein G6P [Salmonella enterica subsp. houtenae serovar 40:z4,z24:-]|nr:Head virion protein G6P [Salmonella enterica]EEJ3210135.1 Head virion protein G6P [Salmonella enterica subsp. houtenae serovar 40:z4,z24:-]EGL9225598.1 Head virion protein G6P [Salmonella enterica]EIU1959083.1 DUF5455 family protein [Salmonella enterica]EKB9853439.1 DUF5455 family protein [Salmonella enterica]
MPFLLGIPALLRFLITLVPLIIGYLASFIARLATRTGLLATALVGAIMGVLLLGIQWLAAVVNGYMPPDFSNLMSSVLPDETTQCITIIMSMKISVFVFDIKDRFIQMANRVL